MGKGKLIVLESTDAAGKSTQTKLITEFYINQNLKVKNFHFPTYTHNESGRLVAKFLQGEYGDSDEVNPYFVANIYAMDRFLFLDELNKMLDENDVVILDRYVFSNAAYQAAKFEINSKEANKIIQWIINLEFGFLELPKQDLCLFLNVPIEIIEGRLAKTRLGADREYLNNNIDIHEADFELQRRVHYTYLNLPAILGYDINNYYTIDCHNYTPIDIFNSYKQKLIDTIKCQ